MRLLEVQGLGVRFGGLVALDAVDVGVGEGETLGVIGPNGSGKTTLFNALTGLYAPAAGRIRFGEHDLVGLETHRIARLGIARTFQASRLCLGLSVFDNILIGMHARRRSGLLDAVVRRGRLRAEMREAVERAAHLLALFSRELPARGFERVGQLPQIDRRRVEICRALASRPRLLLLDEPSAGMNPEETAELMRDLAVVREEMPGLSMIVIEHDMFVIEGVSQRVVALNYGRKIAEGPFAAVAAHAEVREAYLGRESARA
ncbi:MAG: ABC transporter ATP-binding protein [Candidatus Rokubacteria bacterium RIFCSPHIGHO2_12_FULL_73_22]|nr:MAG: ABC transporter ATP-binding protein [Candidatus Rokubacteria bacterium RIFCSPHIGHO2_12_FULL_73_22]